MHRPAGLPAHYHQHTSGDGTDISDYTEIAFLGQYRCERSKAIDARTVELIAAGFAFDDGLGGGVRVFSLSLAAQSKITNAYVLRNEGGFTYPVTWNSIDDSAVVTLADAAAVAAFHGTAAVTARTHEESGTVLKGQIRAATTVAAVDAVVDTR